MKTYTVHHPNGDTGDILNAPEKLVFVKEGLCWPALFIPLLWTLYRRMWIIAAAYFTALMVLNTVVMMTNIPGWVMLAVNLGLNAFMWLDGNELRRWALERRGFKFLDIVGANTLRESERLFLSRLISAQDRQGEDIKPARTSSNALKFAAGDSGAGLYPQFGSDR
ncbi:MAG: DUF2628 domain-containing protein [Hyphomicrobiales bacterium]